jgi:hypothetical protein
VDIRQRRLEFTAKITYGPKGRTIETEANDETARNEEEPPANGT